MTTELAEILILEWKELVVNPYLICDVCNKCIESAYTEEELP